jgi:hypothetical protein
VIVGGERVHWDGFTALPTRLLEPPIDVSREEAWSRHRERLRLLPERLDALEQLAERNGVVVGQRGQRDCASLESWVYRVVMAHGELRDKPGAPVLSLVHDTGMMFGDEQIARYPTLSWQMRRGSPRNTVYHFTVIMGFTRATKGYEAEPVFSYMMRLGNELKGDKHRNRWASIIETAEKYA